MQQILAAGKQQFRCEPYCLPLGPLPRNLIPPLYISSVTVSGSIPVTEEDEHVCSSPDSVVCIIPLSVTVCDSRGQRHVTQSEIRVNASLRPAHNCKKQGAQYAANAFVQLARTGTCFEPGQDAHVYLDVCLQVFCIIMQPMYAPLPAAPHCPDLPLFPPPCRPHPPGGQCCN